jgi:hypothetical protein
MRSKTFRRKNRKMSRRRRAGQSNGLARQTTAEMVAMEEGSMAPATRPTLTRSYSDEFDIEEGRANPQVAIDIDTTPMERPTLLRSNTGELDAMETGRADIESGFRSGSGGRKSRKNKGRKGRKTRKGRRKSHRR